jgi:hypothetical protein
METTERRGDIGQRAAPHAREANSPRYYPDLTIEIGSAAGGAAALIGVVILIGNEGSVAMIPSRADIGMVRPAQSVEIFDAGNQPQHMGSGLKTFPFGSRERRAPVERVIKILRMGEERLGYFISRVWNGWDSTPLQQNPAMRNSHLEGRSSSGIPNYYFRAKGRPDSDCSNPWPISLNACFPELYCGPNQPSGDQDKQASEASDHKSFVLIHKNSERGGEPAHSTNEWLA